MYCVCVIAVGGLTSPVTGPYTEPLYIADKPPDSLQLINSSVDYEDKEEEHQESIEEVITTGRKAKELDDDDEEKAADSNESKRCSPFCPQMLISEPNHKSGKITDFELRKLERGEASHSVLLFPALNV